MKITKDPKRLAFTLIELMVVLAIILALAGITLLFYPKRQARLAADGADRLQTYIASARSRALRDQAPRGVRFVTADGGQTFREIQPIEYPEPLVPNAPPGGGNAASFTVPANGTIATFTMAPGEGLNSTYGISTGDFLEILHGAGSIHRILAADATNLQLASSPPSASVTALTLSGNYRIIRQSRPLMGEPNLQLPDGVFVSGPKSSPARSANFDILFAPSGQVIAASAGRFVLWIDDDDNVSKPTLLTVYTRTGAVAAHPVGPGTDPYKFTTDGRSSGQ